MAPSAALDCESDMWLLGNDWLRIRTAWRAMTWKARLGKVLLYIAGLLFLMFVMDYENRW